MECIYKYNWFSLSTCTSIYNTQILMENSAKKKLHMNTAFAKILRLLIDEYFFSLINQENKMNDNIK